MSITKKRRTSIWAWVLIAVIVVSVIVAAVLHMVNIIDLSFIGTTFSGITSWAAADIVNGVILIGGSIVVGAIGWYIIQTYFIGVKISTVTQPYPQYTPGGVSVSQPQQQDEETVVT